MTVRIAIVRSMDGTITCAGPGDYREQDYPSAMDAALSYHLEAGHIPAASYWITVELPPLPTIPELQAAVRACEFPQSFLNTIIEEGDPRYGQVIEHGPLPAGWGTVK